MRRFNGFVIRSLIIPLTMLALLGCSTLQRTPYLAVDAKSSRVLNIGELRRYSDEPASSLKQEATREPRGGSFSYLALSGGGADGAYGAGILNGWTAAGTRPEFSTVSGVSTGALIAPFAFLGSAYDPVLKEIYTSGVAGTLLESPNPLHVLFGSGLYGNSKLHDLIARYIDQDTLSAIAAQHARGRVLVVVTTNLDTQRTVIWDMGRIASLGSPEALSLFRDVLAASVSIPVVFPPILIQAEANGSSFQEMHVDGGVTAPVLTLPEAFLLHKATLSRSAHTDMYVLMNSKLERDFQVVPNTTVGIAARASASATKTQTRSVLQETYDFARRNNLGFNLTFIDKEMTSSNTLGFDTDYMRSLYQYGYDKARFGNFWAKAPPLDNRSPVTGRTTRSSVVRAVN
jgi:hypothetical protein